MSVNYVYQIIVFCFQTPVEFDLISLPLLIKYANQKLFQKKEHIWDFVSHTHHTPG